MELYIILLCLVGMCLQGFFIIVDHQKKYLIGAILKGFASIFFVTIGTIGYLHVSNNRFGLLILIGLILGSIGDVLLALKFVYSRFSSKMFLIGVCSFLSGHVLYLTALISLSQSIIYCIPIGLIIAGIILFVIFKKIKVKLLYKIFGILYIGIVVVMTLTAIGNVITNGTVNSWLYAFGAILFTISDIILIFNSFGPKQVYTFRIVNLSLYYVGQLLIAICLFYI